MMALLKRKSKLIVERKPRKTYDAAPVFKKLKLQPNDEGQIASSLAST